jgi:hypothetical protein
MICTFLEESKRQFIVDEVSDNFMAIAKDANGITVVKKLI